MSWRVQEKFLMENLILGRDAEDFFGIPAKPCYAMPPNSLVEAEDLAFRNLVADMRTDVGLADRRDGNVQTTILIVGAHRKAVKGEAAITVLAFCIRRGLPANTAHTSP